MKKLLCKLLGHDSTMSFTPNSKSPSGYSFFRHCLRCREVFDEGFAEI